MRSRRVSSRPRRSLMAGIAAVMTLLMSATAAAAAPLEEPTGEIRAAGSPEAIPGRYVIVLHEAVVGAVGTSAAGAAIPAMANHMVGRYGGKVHDVWSAALTGFSAEMSHKQAARLAADPAVAYVEQEQIYRTTHHGKACTGSSGWCQKWAYLNLDVLDQRSKTPDSWLHIPNRGEKVNVYVIDTGVRITHQQFDMHVANRAKWGTNTIDSTNRDCHGHGTHVAGTATGEYYGVAKQAWVYAVKVLNCSGSGTTSSVISGVNWVTANATWPAVANMSLGGPASSALDGAVINSAGSGVFYSIAAGNENQNACNVSPARTAAPWRGILTVGSTKSLGRRSSWSNWGSCVSIFAPGEYGKTSGSPPQPNCSFMGSTDSHVNSAAHTSDTAECRANGTSMAAPLVAGAAALLAKNSPPSAGGPPAWAYAILDMATTGYVTDPKGSTTRFLYIKPTL